MGKKLLAVLFAPLLLLAAGRAPAAGMQLPAEFGLDFYSKRPYHPYYSPSSFEDIDMLSGWPFLTIPDVSIPGDGLLSLEIAHSYRNLVYYDNRCSPLTCDITLLTETGAMVEPLIASPFGLNWLVFNEFINVDFMGWIAPIPKVYVYEQSGGANSLVPCMAEGCPLGEGYWEVYQGFCELGGDCSRREDLYVNDDNWRIEVSMECEFCDGISSFWHPVRATLYLPNGMKKQYAWDEFYAGAWSETWLRLDKIKSPHGAAITVDYFDHQTCDEKFGANNLPKTVTMSGGADGTYKVYFNFEDLEDERAAWEDDWEDLVDPNQYKFFCPRPATWLKSLDVFLDTTYLYSRFFTYYHYPHEAYNVLVAGGCQDWHGANDHFLLNSFIAQSVNGDTLSVTRLDNYHFEPTFFIGGDGGVPMCTCAGGVPASTMAECMDTSDGGAFTCQPQRIGTITTPHGETITYRWNPLTMFDPNIAFVVGNDSYKIIEPKMPSLCERVEQVVIENQTFGRRDSFSFYQPGLEGKGLISAVTINDPTGQNATGFEDWACFVQGSLDSGVAAGRAHGVKKEYHFFDARSIDADDQIWKMWLPTQVVSTAVFPGGQTEPLQRIDYDWVPAPSGLITDIYRSDYLFKPYYLPCDEETQDGHTVCSRQYPDDAFTDSRPWVPTLKTTTVWQDGLTYVRQTNEFDIFQYPLWTTWTMGGTQAKVVRSAYAHLVDPDNHVLGMETGRSSNYSINSPGSAAAIDSAAYDLYTGDVLTETSDYQTSRYAYDSAGNLTTTVNPIGVTNYFSGHVFGKPSQVSLANGLLSATMNYTPEGYLNQVSTGGYTMGYQYNELGQPTLINRPGSLMDTSIDYVVQQFYTPGGGLLRNRYYANTRVEQTTGNRQTVSYLNGWGQPWKVETFAGGDLVRTLTKYDACGGVRYSVPPHREGDLPGGGIPDNIGSSVSFSDAFGRPSIIGDSSGSGAVVVPGRYTTYLYEPNGDELKATSVFTTTTDSWFDSTYPTKNFSLLRGPTPGELFPIETVGPTTDGAQTEKTVTHVYDGKGQVTETRVEGAGRSLVSRFEYDKKGNLTVHESPEAGTRQMQYDGLGRVTSVRVPGDDQGSPSIDYEYDDANRVVEISFHDAVSDSVNYDFDYSDDIGQLVWESGSWSNEGVSYRHDYSYNSSLKLTDFFQHYTFPTKLGAPSDASFLTQYVYSQYGEVDTQTFSRDAKLVLELTFNRDGLGRVVSVSRSGGPAGGRELIKSAEYFPNGSLMRMTAGNNVVTDIHQLYGWGMISDVAIINSKDVTPPDRSGDGMYVLTPIYTGSKQLWREKILQMPSSNHLTADNYLNPLSMVIGPVNNPDVVNPYEVTAEYDHEQQLTGAIYKIDGASANFRVLAFEYDSLGNRTKKTVNGNHIDDYNYDSDNRLEHIDRPGRTEWFNADGRGNVTRTGDHGYRFDLLDRLVAVDDGKVKYFYTASGSKLLKLTAQTVTIYFYDAGGALALEESYPRGGTGAVKSTFYVNVGGQVVATF